MSFYTYPLDPAEGSPKFMVLNAYSRKEEKLKTNDLDIHHIYLGIYFFKNH
jgi:hypothetical protein